MWRPGDTYPAINEANIQLHRILQLLDKDSQHLCVCLSSDNGKQADCEPKKRKTLSGKDVIMHSEALIIKFLFRKLHFIESLTWTLICVCRLRSSNTVFIIKSGLMCTNCFLNSWSDLIYLWRLFEILLSQIYP